MERWDVFHSERLEVERDLTTAEVRAALAEGVLHEDDLVRPAGTTVPWARLADLPALLCPDLEIPTEPPSPPGPPTEAPLTPEAAETDEPIWIDMDDLDLDLSGRGHYPSESIGSPPVQIAAHDAQPFAEEIPPIDFGDDVEESDPQDEDEEAAGFTLARSSAETVEELDLAAMVDVAFQLVLFFLVTATTVLYKTLEIPPPNPERAPSATVQGPSRTLDDLQHDYILVEIDPKGAVKVDHEPAPSEMRPLAERLRAARQATGRTAMLLSADASTPHRNAVIAYDAANEIGLRIAIARPGGASASAPARVVKGAVPG
ncbi:MAG: biopolymer transporter ExbD [Isosphaeraceae bacterium]